MISIYKLFIAVIRIESKSYGDAIDKPFRSY